MPLPSPGFETLTEERNRLVLEIYKELEPKIVELLDAFSIGLLRSIARSSDVDINLTFSVEEE